MSNFFNYLWLVLIALYIISPVDLVPWHIFDDLIAAGVMFYMLYNNARKKKQYQQYYSGSRNQSQGGNKTSHDAGGPLTLDRACTLLGVTPSASWEEISKAYRDKVSKSHPDKVSHLSVELQEKAQELTLRINEAFDLLKRHKGRR